MTSKAATKDKRRRTTMVPVTTMEELPVLSHKERAELGTSLKEAEARMRPAKASTTIARLSSAACSTSIGA